jgi:hypothetical protein
MPTEKTLKISGRIHKRLLQYKANNDYKTFDQAIEQLLKQ